MCNWFNLLKNGEIKIYSIKNNSVVLIKRDRTTFKASSKAVSKILWLLKNEKAENLFYNDSDF